MLGAGLKVTLASLGARPEGVLGLVLIRVFSIAARLVALALDELGAVFLIEVLWS
jgi:hypothetical protein